MPGVVPQPAPAAIGLRIRSTVLPAMGQPTDLLIEHLKFSGGSTGRQSHAPHTGRLPVELLLPNTCWAASSAHHLQTYSARERLARHSLDRRMSRAEHLWLHQGFA